jgi:hypothetical protein
VLKMYHKRVLPAIEKQKKQDMQRLGILTISAIGLYFYPRAFYPRNLSFAKYRAFLLAFSLVILLVVRRAKTVGRLGSFFERTMVD